MARHSVKEILAEDGSYTSAEIANRTMNGTLLTDVEAMARSAKAVTDAKGVSNGIATLDSTGRVPSSQLPSYVDDVVEYPSKTSFPSPGEDGKIYIDEQTNKTYRWSGSSYVEISASLALGETSSTAYAGDKGKKNADGLTEVRGLVVQLNTAVEQAQKDAEDALGEASAASAKANEADTKAESALATKAGISDNNRWGGSNTFNNLVYADAGVDANGVVYSDTVKKGSNTYTWPDKGGTIATSQNAKFETIAFSTDGFAVYNDGKTTSTKYGFNSVTTGSGSGSVVLTFPGRSGTLATTDDVTGGGEIGRWFLEVDYKETSTPNEPVSTKVAISSVKNKSLQTCDIIDMRTQAKVGDLVVVSLAMYAELLIGNACDASFIITEKEGDNLYLAPLSAIFPIPYGDVYNGKNRLNNLFIAPYTTKTARVNYILITDGTLNLGFVIGFQYEDTAYNTLSVASASAPSPVPSVSEKTILLSNLKAGTSTEKTVAMADDGACAIDQIKPEEGKGLFVSNPWIEEDGTWKASVLATKDVTQATLKVRYRKNG